MDPSTRPDLELLRSTWATAAELGDVVPMRFYAVLFYAHPETIPMFPPGMANQRDKLVRALGNAITRIDQLDELTPTLRKLGRDHRRFGAQPHHYGWVLDALLETLRFFFGEEWTEHHTDTWVMAFEDIAQIMVNAAREQDQAEIPPWWDVGVLGVQRSRGQAKLTIDSEAERPKGYTFTPGQHLDVMPPRRPGLWTRAQVETSDQLVVRHRSSSLDFAAMAIASIGSGGLLRIGPPDTEPFDQEETDKHE